MVTYEQWLKMPEYQYGVEEVIDGEIRIRLPNKIPIADIMDELFEILRSQLNRKRVKVFSSLLDLVIRKDPLTVRVPDMAVFERANIVEVDGYIHSAPELVVEASSRDKIPDYESIGVPELWVLSPEAQTVEIMQLSAGGSLETVAIVNQGQIRPKLFPQVTVDVSTIWPR